MSDYDLTPYLSSSQLWVIVCFSFVTWIIEQTTTFGSYSLFACDMSPIILSRQAEMCVLSKAHRRLMA